MAKLLWVGDLHLYDREMSSTRGLIENNQVMLDGIIDVLNTHEDIELLLFAGDIQHKTPRSLAQLYQWQQSFKTMGKIMQERYNEQYTVYARDDIEADVMYPVFSIKGNHDEEISNRRQNDVTFFHLLLQEGLLQNPLGILYEDTYISINNYGEAVQPLVKPEGATQVIATYHDTLWHEGSPDYVNLIKHQLPNTVYPIEELSHGVDLILQGHIHDPEEPEILKFGGHTVTYLQSGSMGRTAIGGSNMRDFGVAYLVDLETLELELVKIPVLPYEDYFDIERVQRKKDEIDAYRSFKLDIQESETSQYQIEESIRGANVSEEIKTEALRLLETIPE